jgi:hypothetical protein
MLDRQPAAGSSGGDEAYAHHRAWSAAQTPVGQLGDQQPACVGRGHVDPADRASDTPAAKNFSWRRR